MNRLPLIMFSLLVFTLCCSADAPDPVWDRLVDTGNNDGALTSCLLLSGDAVIGGYTDDGNVQGGTVPLLIRVTANNSLVSTVIGSSVNFWDSVSVRGLAGNRDGGYVAIGSGNNWGTPFLTRFRQNDDSVWNVRYSSWNGYIVNGVTQTTDSGYVVVGSGYSPIGQVRDLFIARIGRGGGMRGTPRHFGTDSWGRANDVISLPDTGCIVVGLLGVSPGDTVASLGYLMRFRSNGDTLWTRTFGGNNRNEIRSVDRTETGGYILAGYSTAGGRDDYDGWVVCTDAAGQMLWERHFGTTEEEYFNRVATVSGGYILAGRQYVNDAQGYQGYLVWINNQGEMAWSGHVGGMAYDDFTGLVPMPDGGFIASGTTTSFGGESGDVRILRYPPGSGRVGTIRDRTSHAALPNVYVEALGHSRSSVSDARGFYQLFLPAGTYDLITYGACTTRDTLRGVVIGQSIVDTLNWTVDQPHAVIPQSSLNLVVQNHILGSAPLYVRNDGPGLLDYQITTGTSYPAGQWLSVSPAAGSVPPGQTAVVSVAVHADTSDNHIYDYYGSVTVHVNSCPDTTKWIAVIATVLETDERPEAAPREFSLSAFPNPFNPTTTVSYSLPQREQVSLTLYDVTGRQVLQLRNEVQEAGVYREAVDGRNLPAGIYFARLQTTSFNRTHKLVLLK
jgi:hypothetical protein